MADRVLVSGVSGYIGQHCAAELLNRGFEVVGTVRSLAKVETTRSAIAAAAPVDRFTCVEADLLSDSDSDSGWAEALHGCGSVMHVASPFILAAPKDDNALIAPAVDGTRRVIKAAQDANVRRMVLTSSTFAMIAGRGTGRFGPETWSDTDARIGTYAKSKTLAERAAWAETVGSAMELVVINPGAVYGPALGAQVDSESMSLMTNLIGGRIPMLPDIAMGMVDVRDVARLHAEALTSPAAAGHRFIAATAEPVSMMHFATVLRDAGYAKVPSRKAPNAALRVMSMFDRQTRGMVPFLGQKASFDNQATFAILDWKPTPIETSIVEMAASITG